jgi:hypothetical protein
MMNENVPKFLCPCCQQSVPFSELVIDGYLAAILGGCPQETEEVEIGTDASWTPISVPVKRKSPDSGSGGDDDNDGSDSESDSEMSLKRMNFESFFPTTFVSSSFIDLT